jgi:RNA polymerase sigma factor (sigma-70 family)
MRSPWAGWEYRLLNEGHTDEKAARLLKRTVEDVRGASRRRDATWEGWYGRRRRECGCLASPEGPRRLLRLAAKVCRDDFPRLEREEGWERYAYEAIDHALRHFDPERGDTKVPARERFVMCFRAWLRQRLRKEARRRRGAQGLRLRDEHAYETPPHRDDVDAEAAYDWWSCVLFHAALPRLDRRARACVEMRLRGVPDREIAKRLGLSPKTLSNGYSVNRVVGMVRGAVRSLVLGLPVGHLRAVVLHLLAEAGLSFGQVERLLCVDGPDLRKRLRSERPGRVPGLEPEEAVRLLRAA